MESKELNLNKECKAEGSGNGFIDRSKVRILLCDNETKSCEEVFSLLLNSSYQVTSVRSARQVIDALNAEGPEIDIILTEVDLPMTKGMKLLKYITRNKELCRIPVINPSDANTNSTTLFSDDTDERSRKSSNPEMRVSTHQEEESAAVTAEPPQTELPECRPDVPGISDRKTGLFSSVPKKSELRIGESSAFFTYVKSSAAKNSSTQVASSNNENGAQNKSIEENLPQSLQQLVNDTLPENGETWENNSLGDDFHSSSIIPDSLSLERSSTPVSVEFKEDKFSHSQVLVPPRSEPQHDASGLPAQSAYLHYISQPPQLTAVGSGFDPTAQMVPVKEALGFPNPSNSHEATLFEDSRNTTLVIHVAAMG
ncbi:CCT motif-containing response regulator protein isoform 2 [Hibiscus syriacus]|uniref:CCT motif-containing response regulator protein isoform 2 n=1 Tax=Hibiscus syriacus TaxID=106335 RepID=A0A6A2Y7G8_HIBSY|nr:CCT motif-containing response regulator protein isoform 2 [Hibiscus syriacus]